MDWRTWFQESAQINGDSLAASRYDSARSFYVRQRAVMRWLGEPLGQRILDVGTGTGHFSAPLTPHNEVVGVDFVAQMLAYAAPKGFWPAQADARALPFSDASFDAVICVGVLQHIPDYQTALRELLRVLKPQGVLLLDTLNAESLVRWLYYRLTRQPQTMHTYRMGALMADFERLAPAKPVQSAAIYYPLWGYRRVGRRPGLSRFASTSFVVRVG
jgi:ubiquinone/menaquinone biosynthesis C-methylase UbiE